MFGGADEEAAAGAEAGDGEGVGFGAAGGEDRGGRGGAEGGGEGAAGGFEAGAGGAAGGVDARGVADELQRREQGGAGFRAERFGGVGVEVGQGLLRSG